MQFQLFSILKKIEFSRWETEVTEQQFTSQELGKLKAVEPNDVNSVRVRQISELIEQKEQLIEQNKRLLAKDVRSEKEKTEYRSNIAVLEQRLSDLERSNKLNTATTAASRFTAMAFQKKQSIICRNAQIACVKNPIASLVVNLVMRERP